MTSQQTITKSRAPAGTIRAAIPIILLLGLVTLIGALRPSFLTADTLLVVMADTATLFILAAGITFVVMLGGIDLSIQAVASLSSVIVAITLSHIGYWAFPATLLVGFITGAFSGVVHVWLRIPSFIVTLATSGLVAAAALLLSQERSITIGETGRAYLSWITGRPFGIPSVIVVGAVVAVVGIWLQRYTPFGRYSTAIGAGEAATWASGVKVNRQKVIAYSLSAGLAALAGILLTGRLSSGSPTLANELLLPAIASVVVGGTSITGGAGGIGRTVIGALIISVVRVGMTFVGVDIFAQQIVFGTVLILAVAVTIDRTKILIVK
ncbi:MAG: ribose transport system permease protein [Verrucomicrobiota bacterium]|jgi:ribose transport system permease protein|nr:ribose transport system permease protein [Verrucomicrobiota bacterium]